MYCEPDICNWFIWLVKCWTELCCIGPTLCSRLDGVTAVAASWLWVQQKGRKNRWVKNVSVLGGSCSSSPNPKSQLVWYHNCETMGNNDIECCVIAFCNNEETPYEQLRYITGLAVRGHVVVQLYFWVQFYICTSVIVSNLLSNITNHKIKGKIKLNSH